MPSLVDRLTDPESGGSAAIRGYTVEQMTEAVRRDLEDLLNTRQMLGDVPEGLPEVRRSIVGFGLPDLASLNAVTPQQRAEIGRVIEELVALFEPRLRGVRAVLVDAGDDKNRTVKFRIEARLRLDPAPEVAFDTVLELSSGHYSVRPGDGRV